LKLTIPYIPSLLTISLCLLTSHAIAKQGGDQYPHGTEGFMAGAVPPAGDYLITYGVDYRGTLTDDSGDEVKIGNKTIDLRINALSFRWIHITETKLFNGDFGFHLIAPLLNGEIDIAGDSTSMSGLGDMVFDPFIAWHYPNLHLVAGIDFFLPTGQFDKDEAINAGAGYWSYEPLVALTYLNDSGYEASAKLMYNIKTENDDTNTLSGDEFHMDYTLAKHDGPWTYGIGGYYVQQIQDDEVDGKSVDNSKRRSLAIGPQVKYDHENMSFIGKYQIETASRNTFEGNRLNLKLIVAF
jgi:hypothetical protein